MIERSKSIFDGTWKFVSEIAFSKYCSFDFRGDDINTKIGSKRAQTCTSCINGDRKMKVNSKEKLGGKYLFSKPLSQNFEVLSPRGDVINPKFARKKAQTLISCTNGERKMKIKSKRNFEVRYSFVKLFF